MALGLYLYHHSQSRRPNWPRTGWYYLVAAIVSGFRSVLYGITMSAGLAPVKGLTLPLSYGGSSLVATFAGFGLILSVRMRRFITGGFRPLMTLSADHLPVPLLALLCALGARQRDRSLPGSAVQPAR